MEQGERDGIKTYVKMRIHVPVYWTKTRPHLEFHLSSELKLRYVASSKLEISQVEPIDEPMAEHRIWMRKTTRIYLLVIFIMFEVL